MPELTTADFEEITKLRLTLETHAIEEICLGITESDVDPEERLAALDEACDQFDQFLRGGYSLGAIEADQRFHEALIDAAGSRRLSMLYQRAPLPLIHHQFEDPAVWREVCTQTLLEHRQILAAVASGNSKLAKSLSREHVNKRSLVPIGK